MRWLTARNCKIRKDAEGDDGTDATASTTADANAAETAAAADTSVQLDSAAGIMCHMIARRLRVTQHVGC